MAKSSSSRSKDTTVAPSKGNIAVTIDICAGCRTCEAVCSLYKEGISNPELSRIHVFKDELDGYRCEPQPCRQCVHPGCLPVCPTGALHVDDVTGTRVIDEMICDGCQLCMQACVFKPKRIRFNAQKKVCFKCDLCGGEPQCVKFCPTGALTYRAKE
jgi:Fe-S-cluster-containing dehydrogenase component